MISQEQVFLWNIDRLREIVLKPSPQGLLESSAILRKLLLDGENLIEKVNRDIKFNVRFTVTNLPHMRDSMMIGRGTIFSSEVDLLFPGDLGPNVKTLELKIEKFLALEKVFYNGQYLTIYNIIDFIANNAGGVHIDVAKKKSNKLLNNLGSTIHSDGMPLPLREILPIARVVLEGCKPLYEEISNRKTSKSSR